MIPQYIHIMTNGDVWISTERADTPTGTVAGVFCINGNAPLTKVTTISGSAGSYTVSGANGKAGREIGAKP